MKKGIVILLVLILTACQPKIVYVVVTATPGPAEMTPVVIPTETRQAPADTATTTSAPAEVATDTPVQATEGNPPAEGAVFTNITRSGDQLFLQCPPAETLFTVTSLDPNVTDVDLWYRMLDKKSGINSSWLMGKRMTTTDNANFTLTFSAIDINANFRYKEAWLDFQFVGMNKYGNVIARSDKFVQQITFTLACP